MNEDSDGINENENNNSEVVILPERSHVEELLLSDQSQVREDQSDYERKLDEKLKDLGLYEDDMTINQKEELLAVVVISCETAEQEENKRQLIREYLEGAQSLEEEIEFSFQESAWLADEANLLCSSTITRSQENDTSDTKLSSSFVDSEQTAGKNYDGGFDSLDHAEGMASKNSNIFGDESAYTEISMDPQSSTSEDLAKKQASPKGRPKGGRKLNLSDADTAVKVGITHPILQGQDSQKPKTEELFDRQVALEGENVLMDKSMSSWKPCMSPKDRPLSNFRMKEPKAENVSSSCSSEDKVKKYLASFERIASSLKKRRSSSKLVQLNKPYVLLHHGSVAKKACKLDNYDYIIGVTDQNQSNETDDSFNPCSTLTRAKSAFHRVKPTAQGKYVSFSDHSPQSDTPSKTTRSGASYGSEKHLRSDPEKSESSPEVIFDDTFNQNENETNNQGFPKETFSEKRVTFQEDLADDTNRKLPKFSDLKPEIGKYSNMIVPYPINKKDNSQCETGPKQNCHLHVNIPEKSTAKVENLGNASEQGYSSDSSSPLIDVETIVDEEIEEFVMKRKLTPSTQKSNYTKNPGHSKKLKKNES